jgi:hypothetical protein
VVEASLSVPAGCAGKLQWQTAGMFGEATIAEPWDGVGEAVMAEPKRHKRGLLVGCNAHTGGKPQWVCYNLDETIEKPCSDLLVIHHRTCIHGRMEIL